MTNRIEDRGARLEKPKTGVENRSTGSDASSPPDPVSPILDPAAQKRMQWRCRRGLLELDIFLQPFVARHYATLSAAELRVFDALLDMPDNTLWDMMSGRQATGDAAQSALLEKIKSV